jgi:hypothetical protein
MPAFSRWQEHRYDRSLSAPEFVDESGQRSGVRADREPRRHAWRRWLGPVLCAGATFAALGIGRVWGEKDWLWNAMPPEQMEMYFRCTHFRDGAIQCGSPDERYVCHEWAFCGGPNESAAMDPEGYLRQHQFQQVAEPEPGDLIIYRSKDSGEIIHSGVVKAVGNDSFVLIESKWGARGRYLHLPDSANLPPASHAYYRSPTSLP